MVVSVYLSPHFVILTQGKSLAWPNHEYLDDYHNNRIKQIMFAKYLCTK